MLLNLFYEIDNFCKAFLRFWKKFAIKQGLAKRIKPCRLCLSEIMTIVVNFHISGFRTFKDYYIKHVCVHLRKEFPLSLRVTPAEKDYIPKTCIGQAGRRGCGGFYLCIGLSL